MVTSAIAVLVTSAAIIIFYSLSLKNALYSENAVHAEVIARNCRAAIAFDVPKSAHAVLSTLKSEPAVVFACILDSSDTFFAQYRRQDAKRTFTPEQLQRNRGKDMDGLVHVAHHFHLDEQVSGTVHILADTSEILATIKKVLVIIALAFMIGLTAAYFISLWLQRAISNPILSLSNIARSISRKKDYSIRAVKDTGGEVGILIDSFNEMLSEIQAGEISLRNSREKFLALVGNIPEAIYSALADEKGTSVFMSDKWSQWTGYNTEDPEIWQKSVHPDDRERTVKAYLESAREKRDYIIDYRLVHKDTGEVHWVWDHGIPILDDKGNVIRYEGIVTDITERRQAEQERLRLSTAIEQAAEVIVVTDKDGTIQYVNPAFTTITGYSEDESVGQNPKVLQSGRHPDSFYKQLWSTILRGEVWRGYFVNKKKDGSLYDEEATISPVKNKLGEITNFVAVKRDITQELQQERQLQQGQKMESIGTLAGGVAHEFNNILGGMLGYAEIAKDDAPANSPVQESLDEIAKLGMRARDVVRQILSFSRKDRQESKLIQPHIIVTEELKVLRATIPTTVEIRHKIDEKSGSILGDQTQIQQVIMNLCMNAAHAMEEKGGVLDISLSPVVLDAEEVKPYLDLKPGEYAKLTIKDTGAGIDPGNIDKIFDPFFTTKEVGKGTGMGLSVVHGIIKDHGGAIGVSSKLGEGTTFTVFLPKAEGEVEAKKAEESLPTGTENILLVDDEEFMVFPQKKILERLEYTVTAMTSSLEALELFKNDPQRYDLIITDLTMPHMTGDRLAAEVTGIRPDMPVILATGYADAVDDERVIQSGIKSFIPKPCNKQDLAKTIRLILDE